MSEILNLRTVADYNAFVGVETLHPLVSVVDWSTCPPLPRRLYNYGFYAVFLKDVECGDLRYGRRYYDYQEGTLVCLAPGQVAGSEDDGTFVRPKGWALCFHPDLLHGTALGRRMKEYTFFSYESREALHLSERERAVVLECFGRIAEELRHDVDRHSRRLITDAIGLLLDYCVRFYERQFITRSHVNHDLLDRFERLLDDYFAGDAPQRDGLPSVRWCADRLCLSANYFGDLVKRETGKTAQEYIHLRLVDEAKERMADGRRSVAQVAYELGFRYPQHFSRLFRRVTGVSPVAYRSGISS